MTRKKLDIELHKQFLLKALISVFKTLDNRVVFKGGTCALLFYDLPRFSFDLDFDILTSLTKTEIDKLKDVFEKDFQVKQAYDKKFTVFYLLDYQLGTPNIKIEMNKRVYKYDQYKTIRFFGIEMMIVDKATLLSNKIIALANRKHAVARDLFDVYHLLGLGFPLDEKIIKEKTGKSLKAYLQFLPSFIKKNYTERNILQGLGETLDEEQKRWAKKYLVEDTIKQIKKIKL